MRRSLTRPARKQRLLVAGGLVAVGVALVGWLAWGPVRDWRDARSAKGVLTPFAESIRDADYDAACRYLASTAALRVGGGCPDRLRRNPLWRQIADGLDGFDTEVEGRDGDRLIVSATRPGPVVLGGGELPLFFVFVREHGDLRIQRFLGYGS